MMVARVVTAVDNSDGGGTTPGEADVAATSERKPDTRVAGDLGEGDIGQDIGNWRAPISKVEYKDIVKYLLSFFGIEGC